MSFRALFVSALAAFALGLSSVSVFAQQAALSCDLQQQVQQAVTDGNAAAISQLAANNPDQAVQIAQAAASAAQGLVATNPVAAANIASAAATIVVGSRCHRLESRRLRPSGRHDLTSRLCARGHGRRSGGLCPDRGHKRASRRHAFRHRRRAGRGRPDGSFGQYYGNQRWGSGRGSDGRRSSVRLGSNRGDESRGYRRRAGDRSFGSARSQQSGSDGNSARCYPDAHAHATTPVTQTTPPDRSLDHDSSQSLGRLIS